jgi:hypothetical protein
MNNHDKLIQEINQIPDHLIGTLIDIIHQLKKHHLHSSKTSQAVPSSNLNAFIGALKQSPSSSGDPVTIQR